MITNIQLPATFLERMRTVEPLAELEKHHPCMMRTNSSRESDRVLRPGST
jgi:hypothetical protein